VKFVSKVHDAAAAADCDDLLPYLTLLFGWAYTSPSLRLYQFGPIHVPECNHKFTVNGCEDGCEAVHKHLQSCTKVRI